MKRRQIVLLSFISIVLIMIIGFNQKETLNFTQYYERRQLWLEIVIVLHVATVLLLAIYNYFRNSRYLAVSFLICFGLDVLLLLVSAFIMLLNFEGIPHL